MEKKITFLILAIMLSLSVVALDFNPRGNIDMKDYYNITNLNYIETFTMIGNLLLNSYNIVNGNYINATYFFQDGSAVLTTESNDSMKVYVDAQDVAANTSIKNYADNTFITQANEGNLNVNSSSYWDNLSTPSDINAGDITDDGTYLTSYSETDPYWTGNQSLYTTFPYVISVGNWSDDKSDYTTTVYVSANYYDNTEIGILSSALIAGYTIADGVVKSYAESLGNWSSDKSDYYTSSQVDDKGYLITSNLSNTTPISLTGTTYGLTNCSDGQVYYFNSSTGGWTCSFSTGGGGGTSDHAALNNLDYASAGHTGFASDSDAAGWVNDSLYTNTTRNVQTDGNIYLGNTNGDHYIYFYYDGSPTGAAFYWDDSAVRFRLDYPLEGQTIIGTNLIASDDIYTIGSNDDLWLGNPLQASALNRLYANGSIQAKNVEVTDDVCITGGNCLSDTSVSVETDPYWSGNESLYYTSSQVEGFSYYNSTNPPPGTTGSGWTNDSLYTNTSLNVQTDGDVYIGNSNEDHYIYFYNDDSYSQAIKWDESDDEFYISNDLNLFGNVQVLGKIESSSDIYTTGAGDDLWLGTSTQASANVQLNATGDAYFKNDVAVDSVTFHDGSNVCMFFNGSAIILNNNADGVTCP